MDDAHQMDHDDVVAIDDPGIWSDFDLWDAELDGPAAIHARSSRDGHAVAMDELEAFARQRRIAVAREYRLIAEILEGAQADPDPWVGPDPTLDPLWIDPRGRSTAEVRRARRDVAVRAAAADVAVRLRLSETVVRTRAVHVATLRARTPGLWSSFLDGAVSEQNAVTAALLAGSLPDECPESWAEFDGRISVFAAVLTPAKFRVSARVARERAHPESVETRHARAAADRGVWTTPELDGMGTFVAYGRAADVQACFDRVDAIARHLAAQDGETRSLAQLRADVAMDVLTGGVTDAVTAGIRATVAVTVPVLSLLGESVEPATLDGYGPIDLDTAKRLAAGASSWIRVLTHPVSSAVLDVDRRSYRVPADLRRWLTVTHATCIFPGCSRPARECDIDHRIDWQHGGATRHDNLGPACEHHHTVKGESLWGLHRRPDTGDTWWTSPTGAKTATDPPPF
ncbi:HNH endonuclease [Microbacterium sp. NPDC019599]|uniref:HNH endonuclease signature motif containing protein n=1 Tax=Microbacterium sp. NPDC019599 TaxID=3154690 RepID=UPI00340E1C44